MDSELNLFEFAVHTPEKFHEGGTLDRQGGGRLTDARVSFVYTAPPGKETVGDTWRSANRTSSFFYSANFTKNSRG